MKIHLLSAASYGASPIHLHKRPSNEHSRPSAYQQLLSMPLNFLVVSFAFHHVVEVTLLDDESDHPFPSTNHLGYQAFHLFLSSVSSTLCFQTQNHETSSPKHLFPLST